MNKEKIILIVGNKKLLNSMKDILGLSVYDVTAIEDYRKAIEILSETPSFSSLNGMPDLIICDADFQKGDDGPLSGILRQSSIPIIFIGEFPDKVSMRRAMAAGADDCLGLPFEAIELLSCVESCLHRRRRQHRISKGKSIHPGNADLERILGQMPSQACKKKASLYSEGQHAAYVWYIVSGKIKTFRIHDEGKELVTNIYGPGEFVGYFTALDGACYHDSARFIEDAILIPISRQKFMDLMQTSSGVSQQLLRLLARHSALKDEGLLDLAYSSLRKRVANGLLQLAAMFPADRQGRSLITISRDNLAGIIGSAPESLTRTLSEFRKENLIELQEGVIVLLDTERLRKLAN